MRKKNYRGVRCEKRSLPKCEGVCRTYDVLQARYAEMLSEDPEVKSFRCNVPLDGDCDEYMTDFMIEMANGRVIVRECVFRKLLKRKKTVEMLAASQQYWWSKGICDWKLVIDALPAEEGKGN